MNYKKAEFFDGQADSLWAAPEYSDSELDKIDWLFDCLQIKEGIKILEPGCGTGRITEILAEKTGDRGLVVAMDISREMINRCRQRLSEKSGISIHHAGLEDLELEDGFFDLVLCFNVFPHLDDKPGACRLFYRVLKPGATVAIFHLQPSSFINDLHRKAGTVIENDMIPDCEELAAMLCQAGFEPVEFRDDDRFLALAKKT